MVDLAHSLENNSDKGQSYRSMNSDIFTRPKIYTGKSKDSTIELKTLSLNEESVFIKEVKRLDLRIDQLEAKLEKKLNEIMDELKKK